MMDIESDPWGSAGFNGPIGEAPDWRLLLAFDALDRVGAFASESVSIQELARRHDLDADAVLRLGRLLERGGVVEVRAGAMLRGRSFPSEATRRVLARHVRTLRQWSASLDDRVHGLRSGADARAAHEGRDPGRWLASMADRAGSRAVEVANLVEVALGTIERGRVLDIGGGHGAYAKEFARRGFDVTLFDVAEIVDVVTDAGWLADTGVKTHAGDLRESLPDGPFDVVLCLAVNHMFDRATNRRLFARVNDIVRPDGVVVVGNVVSNGAGSAEVFSVHMLVTTDGGDTYTEAEYSDWLSAAGFVDVRSLPASDDEQDRMLLLGRAAPRELSAI